MGRRQIAGVKGEKMIVQEARTIVGEEELMNASGLRQLIVEKDKDIKAQKSKMIIIRVE